MGLFKQKDKKADDDFAQDVPQFKPFSDGEKTKLPEIPNSRREKEMFPSYQSEFSGIKKEIQKPVFAAPKQMPQVQKPTMMKRPETQPNNFASGPSVEVERHNIMGDKPIYVKIDQYKDAMSIVDRVKELCNEADQKLSEISKLRSNEDRELEQWQSDVDKIKEKLLQIDKKLFEI